mmetsp:Transcript_35581/g.74469  ORF Transcript_35581/g.74469 Transcript_35581/m.74469 type:complete len:82 (+) Transcript_35581:421-666(+)
MWKILPNELKFTLTLLDNKAVYHVKVKEPHDPMESQHDGVLDLQFSFSLTITKGMQISSYIPAASFYSTRFRNWILHGILY